MTKKQDIDLAVDQLMRATLAPPELAMEVAKHYYQHMTKVMKKPSLWIAEIERLRMAQRVRKAADELERLRAAKAKATKKRNKP